MMRFLRLPKRFYVRVHGSNFELEVEDSEPIVGFYTNRWVDAFDSTEAIQKAYSMIKARMKKQGFDSILGQLHLEAEEVREVSFWTERWSKTQGLLLYPKQKNKCDGHRPPLH